MAITEQNTLSDSDSAEYAPPSDALHETLSEAEAEDMPTPYWGVASGSSVKALRIASTNEVITDHGHTINGANFPTPRHIELSYATENRTSIWKGPSWFIDCGGYSELTGSDDGTYQSSLRDYIDYLLKHIERGVDIQYWALRDWPVTDELLREHGRTERDHQRWTVKDHHRSLRLAHETGLIDKEGVEPICVLQGQDVAGYLFHLDLLRESGLLTDHICIGSAKSLNRWEVEDIAEAVRKELPSKHTLHGLGVTQQTLAHPGVREHFDTFDTQVWNHETNRLPDRLADVQDTWIGYLHAFEQYVDRLQSQTGTVAEVQQGIGTSLFEFGRGKKSVTGHTSSSLIECACGTTFDPNAIIDSYDENVVTENTHPDDALDGPGCRHCRRKLLNFRMQCMDGDLPEELPPKLDHHTED